MAVKYAPNIYLNIHLNIDLSGRFEGVSESAFGIYWLNIQFTILDGTFLKALLMLKGDSPNKLYTTCKGIATVTEM